jgi:methyltransferase
VLIRAAVCGGMAVARLVELGYSKRNIEIAGESAEGEWSRRTFPAVAALHAAVIGGTFALGGRPRWPWLLLLAAAQPLRAWVLMTLGVRWNARAAVPKEMSVATDGTYAYVRHPNYTILVVELATLPLGFGLGRLALAGLAANAVLLAFRIRDEERLLAALPGYEAHFRDKPRFLPGLF